MKEKINVSVYRRSTSGLRGQIIGRSIEDRYMVYKVKVTTRTDCLYKCGEIIHVPHHDIFDRELKNKVIGKSWYAKVEKLYPYSAVQEISA